MVVVVVVLGRSLCWDGEGVVCWWCGDGVGMVRGGVGFVQWWWGRSGLASSVWWLC